MPRVFEKQHFKNSQIYDTDDFFASHNSSNDFSVTLAQIQSMPVGKCQTASDVAAKVVTLLADSFGLFTIKDKTDSTKGLIGRTISVNFTNKNTASSMTLNVASTGAFPVTSHGVAVKAGAIGVGNYTFRFMPYGSSYSWDVLDNNGLIEVKSDKNVFWDNHEELTAAQVNSALTNLIADKNYTITLTGDGVSSTPPQTVYNTETLKIGDMYLCTFDILCGEITESKVAFLTLSSINTSSFRLVGEMYFYSTGNKVTINSLANKTGWLWNGADRLRTDYFSGKRIKGFLIAYPYSAPATQSLD